MPGRRRLLSGSPRLTIIEADLAASATVSVLAPFAAAESAVKVWGSLDLARKRAVIGAIATITLHPAGQGARVFSQATVHIDRRSE
jgi:hypothetical protein